MDYPTEIISQPEYTVPFPLDKLKELKGDYRLISKFMAAPDMDYQIGKCCIDSSRTAYNIVFFPSWTFIYCKMRAKRFVTSIFVVE